MILYQLQQWLSAIIEKECYLNNKHWYGTRYHWIRPLLTKRCYWKNILIKTLISQTLLFETVAIFPDEYFSLVYLLPSYSLSVTVVVIGNINYSRFCYCICWDCSSFRFQYYSHSDAKSQISLYRIFSILVTNFYYILLIKPLLRKGIYFYAVSA